MNPAEKAVVSVEANRQQQNKQAHGAAQKRQASSRGDLYVFLGVLVLAILSVVALFLKGGK
jgi:hypothetical protein